LKAHGGIDELDVMEEREEVVKGVRAE